MRVILTVIALALLWFAAPVMASIQYLDADDHGCAGDMSTDDCFSDPTGTVVYGGDYIQCTAKGNQKQGCWTVVEVPQNGKLVKKCGKVQYSASCSCDSATLQAKGYCTFYR
jgi:hypothetical protein